MYQGVPEWRPLYEVVTLTPGLPWRTQDVGDTRAMVYLSRKAANREWNSPKERSVLQSTKLTGVGDLKSVLTSDMEMQSLEFVQLIFSLTLVQYFLTMPPSLCFGMVMNILCHYMLEVCDLYFGFIGDTVKRLHESH